MESEGDLHLNELTTTENNEQVVTPQQKATMGI
jgi:hypothetical protein